MGYRLYRHVLDHAPADLTSGERLLLLVIADDANDDTRLGRPGTDLLTHRTGIGSRGLRKALERLAERGFEVRVPITEDENGHPVFAVRGRRTTYRVPVFPLRQDIPMGAPQFPHSDEKGGTTVPKRRNHSSGKEEPQFLPLPQSPQSPHHARTREDHQPADSSRPPKATKKTKKQNSKQPIDFVMDLGATETEAAAVIHRLETQHNIGNMPGFLAHATENGSLQGHLDAIRNARRRRSTIELCDEHTRPADRCPFCAAERNTA